MEASCKRALYFLSHYWPYSSSWLQSAYEGTTGFCFSSRVMCLLLLCFCESATRAARERDENDYCTGAYRRLRTSGNGEREWERERAAAAVAADARWWFDVDCGLWIVDSGCRLRRGKTTLHACDGDEAVWGVLVWGLGAVSNRRSDTRVRRWRAHSTSQYY